MICKIRNKVEHELAAYIRDIKKQYSLHKISPLLYERIKDFASRTGKRVRPVLFVTGYLGFAGKPAPGLFRSAASLELFHDFMLVHDDIVDRSETRRGKPSMHAMFNRHLAGCKGTKLNGQDLALVAGDVMYAMAIEAFLSVKENPAAKEKALRRLIQAGVYTGSGEFIELLLGAKDIKAVGKEEIYRVYDLKTANYTFATPLCMGAALAGAAEKEIKILYDYGICLGRAFQIKDDIIGIFSDEAEIGKSNLTDLQEGKKTILVWRAWHNCGPTDRESIRRILSDSKINRNDLNIMRKIISGSGSLDYAKKEIAGLIKKAAILLNHSRMKPRYKKALNAYIKQLLGF